MKRLVVALLALATTIVAAPGAQARLSTYATVTPKRPSVGQAVRFVAHGCHAAPCRYRWAVRNGTRGRFRTLGGWRRSAVLVLTFRKAGRKQVLVRLRDARLRRSRWTIADGRRGGAGRRGFVVTRRTTTRGGSGSGTAGGGSTASGTVSGGSGTSGGGSTGSGTGTGSGGSGGGSASTPPPGVLPAPYGTCTTTVSSTAAAASAISSAPAGGVVCLADGTYAGLSVSASRASDATLQAEHPGAAHVSGITLSGARYTVAGFDVSGSVQLQAGATGIRVSHNHIHGGDYGVSFVSTDCTAPNAPKWSACEPQAPISGVTVDGNKIHDVSVDALYVNNWRDVRISGNEIYGVVESGEHNDCLQSVFGGSGMVFDHNYEHDNNCQGFFIKDGDARDVTLTQNLFVRNRAINASENTVQVYNTVNFVFQHNTDWSGNGWVVRADNAAQTPTATVDHNYIYSPARITDSGPAYQLTEDYNTFHDRPSGFTAGPHSNVLTSPAFVAPATDDYRVAGSGRGIDWRPADLHFGP